MKKNIALVYVPVAWEAPIQFSAAQTAGGRSEKTAERAGAESSGGARILGRWKWPARRRPFGERRKTARCL